MKRIYALILALPLFLQAQQERSLFWEISGNGLTKKSYLYGTMHVNEKVSYHLPDSFYDHLLAADIVANESSPETWHGVVENLTQRQSPQDGNFYAAFHLSKVQRAQLQSLFRNNNYFSSMLSGLEDGRQADFQENTVLDMFIHQTGRKYKKQSVGLENAQQSLTSIFRMEEKDLQPSEQNREILVKLLKNGSFQESLRQYYREKDIYMLDSIYKLIFSRNGHQILITNRNAIMTRSIDSLVRKGSLFAGVGAAHLAGKEGIIEMLRAKGYTVRPASDIATDAGKRKKKMIEEYFPHGGFEMFSDTDKMITLPLNRNKFRSGYNIGSPDYDNGGVINLKRLPINDFLTKDPFSHQTIDSLLYENIPGEILQKTFISGPGFSGYDVRNVTKTGNAQRYRFYVTPLEIITVSMMGNGQYIRQYESQVFDKITLAAPSSNWISIDSPGIGFSAEMPTYHARYGTDVDAKTPVMLQAYDPSDKSYYFISEQIMDNTAFLEETAYEHKQLHYEFLKQHKADTTSTTFNNGVYFSKAEIGGKQIRLASVINGPRYYLLGAVNADDQKASRFFRSFSVKPVVRTETVETYTDSAYGFSITVPKKSNGRLLYHLDKSVTKPEPMSQSMLSYRFEAENGYGITVVAQKYHPYYTIAKDSIIPQIRREITSYYSGIWTNSEPDYDDYDFEPTLALLSGKKGIPKSRWYDVITSKEPEYEILTENITYDPSTQTHRVDALVSRPESTQAIRQRVLVRPDGQLHLSALVDRKYANDDPFLERALNTLAFSSPLSETEFEDPFDRFLSEVQSENDSIRRSALESVYHLEIGKQHYDKLEKFLANHEFEADQQWYAEAFFEKLASADMKRAIPFLLNYYRNNEGIASIQLKILAILAGSDLRDRYKIIQDLMEEDLPLTDNSFEISSLFQSSFIPDLENSRALFPAVLQFCGTDEYRRPVMEFCLALRDKGYIRNKALKATARQMLINANSEYKRVANRKRKSVDPLYPHQTSDLIDYINVLYAHSSDAKIRAFLDKCRRLDIAEINLEFLRLDVVEGNHERAALAQALKKPGQKFVAIQLMLERKDDSFGELSDEEIATSAIEGYRSQGPLSTELLHSETVRYGAQPVTFYFFEIATKSAYDDSEVTQLQMAAFLSDGKRIDPGGYLISTPFEDVDEENRTERFKSLIRETLYGRHQRATEEGALEVADVLEEY